MKTAEEILKSKIDELSQHNNSYPPYKNTDPVFKKVVLEAMMEYLKVKTSEPTKKSEMNCNHNDTVFRNIRCDVCIDCGEIVETDV